MIAPLPQASLMLETKRLWISPLTIDDVELSTALLCDPDVMKYVSDPMTPDAVRQEMPLVTRRAAGGRFGIWVARHKGAAEGFATCVLTPVPIDDDDVDWDAMDMARYPDGQIEVGYLLRREAWGQGFATEICARLLQFAFEQTRLTQVVATTDPDNRRSQAVLEKCGMQPIGLRRAYGWDDVSWFVLSKERWQNRRTG